MSLRGAVCMHCELFPMKNPRKEGQPSAPRGSGPAAAEVRRKLSLWGSQELLDEEMESKSSQTSCPAYYELLEVMERVMTRLDLPWKQVKKVVPRGCLDERFLSDHNPPAQVSLPFLPDLHSEASSLPSEPLQRTSSLNGRAYVAAGQAVASLLTMAVLQAYQADLLKDLDKGQGLSPDEVAELRHIMDLALWASEQAATAMGRSTAAMVITERQLWVNLADLRKKEKGCGWFQEMARAEGRSSRFEEGGQGEAFPTFNVPPNEMSIAVLPSLIGSFKHTILGQNVQVVPTVGGISTLWLLNARLSY
ncbi:Nonribosomal peptide synthetase [Labeo rohita]|uniref:Nonribosomal peptide synthetase n=1 Tax=Labeo rohita TaxID=84645 RepID=A0ABQ8LZ31_LABRO|nr:Nonribosomal peptide synthetase [Labeo rohita]